MTAQEQAARALARRSLGLDRRGLPGAGEPLPHEPQYQAALDDIEDLLDAVQEHAADPGIAQMRTEALEAGRYRRFRWGVLPFGVAAALVLAGMWIGGQIGGGPAVHQETQLAAYVTGKGERRVIELVDGSKMTLDTGSHAEITFQPRARRIRLLSGQALFEVAKDPTRPFSVEAGSLEVTALGTIFDVRVEADQAKVTLVEGSVVVEPALLRGLARLVPALARHQLTPGQELVARNTGELSVGTADVESVSGWRSGRLVFHDEPLAAAVMEFNRYNSKQLVIEDRTLERLSVNGVFDAARPDDFLAAIATLYDVQVVARGQNVAVLRFESDRKK